MVPDNAKIRPRHIPTPTGKGFVPQPRDLFIYQALATYGDLTLSYLYPLLKQHFPSRQYLQYRLALLFHDARLLDRPPQQWRTFNARSHEAVYSLNKASRKICEANNIPILKQDGHWEHEHMAACVTGSLAIYGGYTPHPIQQFTTQIDGKEVPVIPDAIGDMNGRTLIIEVDRGTEPHISENKKRKSTERMFSAWRQLIGSGQAQDQLNSRKVLLLYVTTNPNRKYNAIDVLKNISSGKVNYILFNHIDLFDIVEGTDLIFFTPKPPFKHLATEPWDRLGNEPFLL